MEVTEANNLAIGLTVSCFQGSLVLKANRQAHLETLTSLAKIMACLNQIPDNLQKMSANLGDGASKSVLPKLPRLC